MSWIEPVAAADTRRVYVSTAGSDSNNGLSEATPVKTLRKGYALLRNGYPDWLLLKRGDTFSDPSPFCTTSGRSLTQPQLIAGYGDGPRPVLLGGMPQMTAPSTRGVRCDWIRLDGLCFRGTPGKWLGPSKGLVFQDCLWQSSGMSFQSFYGKVEGLELTRCIVLDNFSTVGRAQGIYCDGVAGVKLESCTFDHNGWIEGAAPATLFNHNIYISANCSGLVVTNCFISNASSHGLQARCGGTITDNVFYGNPIALSFGYVIGDVFVPEGVSGTVSGNLIVGGGDIGGSPRGFGMQISNLSATDETLVSGNIVAKEASLGGEGYAFELNAGMDGVGIHNLTLAANMVLEWDRPILLAGGLGSRITQIDIRDNAIQQLTKGGPLITQTNPPAPAEVMYRGNTYWSPGPAEQWFKLGTQALGFKEWVGKVEEEWSRIEQMDLVKPQIQFDPLVVVKLRKRAYREWFNWLETRELYDDWDRALSRADHYDIGGAVKLLKAGRAVRRPLQSDGEAVTLQEGKLEKLGLEWIPSSAEMLAEDWREC